MRAFYPGRVGMPVPSPGRFVSAQVLSQGNVGGQLTCLTGPMRPWREVDDGGTGGNGRPRTVDLALPGKVTD